MSFNMVITIHYYQMLSGDSDQIRHVNALPYDEVEPSILI